MSSTTAIDFLNSLNNFQLIIGFLFMVFSLIIFSVIINMYRDYKEVKNGMES
jgi:uncharacterized membrane protein YbhN (UPF0104 family)